MKDMYTKSLTAILGFISALLILVAAIINVGIWNPSVELNLYWVFIIGILILILAIYLFRKRKESKFQYIPTIVSGPIEKYYFKEMPFVNGAYWNAYTEDYPMDKKFKNEIKVNINGNPHCPECKTEFNIFKALVGYTWKCPMCDKKMHFKDDIFVEKENVKKIIKSLILRSFEKN